MIKKLNLNYVVTGADIASGPVWMEYIAFLKSLPVGICFLLYLYSIVLAFSFFYFSCPFCLVFPFMIVLQAQTSPEETQRMTTVRKAYQKAIITPTHHIEQLWRDYENFENSVSRPLVIFCS